MLIACDGMLADVLYHGASSRCHVRIDEQTLLAVAHAESATDATSLREGERVRLALACRQRRPAALRQARAWLAIRERSSNVHKKKKAYCCMTIMQSYSLKETHSPCFYI